MRNRSVLELMVLLFTATVCFSILATGAAVAIIEIKDSTTDTSGIVQSLFSLVSGILGALLGLIAGKATNGERNPVAEEITHHPDDEAP